MKPCGSCPFRRSAIRGLWVPDHYLRIAYLGSAETLGAPTMGCHKHNKRPAEEVPLCSGWLRSAGRRNIAVRLYILTGKLDPAETERAPDVMSPEEMVRVNGLDLSRLPPLRWSPDLGVTYEEWTEAHAALRRQLRDDPDLAWTYVLPDSPLARGVRLDDDRHFHGEE